MHNIMIQKSFHNSNTIAITCNPTNATKSWVSADIACSSPTNTGLKQHADPGYHSQFKVAQTIGK